MDNNQFKQYFLGGQDAAARNPKIYKVAGHTQAYYNGYENKTVNDRMVARLRAGK